MFTLNVLKHVKRPNVRVNGQVRECNMVVWVIEVSSGGYKIGKIFA